MEGVWQGDGRRVEDKLADVEGVLVKDRLLVEEEVRVEDGDVLEVSDEVKLLVIDAVGVPASKTAAVDAVGESEAKDVLEFVGEVADLLLEIEREVEGEGILERVAERVFVAAGKLLCDLVAEREEETE